MPKPQVNNVVDNQFVSSRYEKTKNTVIDHANVKTTIDLDVSFSYLSAIGGKLRTNGSNHSLGSKSCRDVDKVNFNMQKHTVFFSKQSIIKAKNQIGSLSHLSRVRKIRLKPSTWRFSCAMKSCSGKNDCQQHAHDCMSLLKFYFCVPSMLLPVLRWWHFFVFQYVSANSYQRKTDSHKMCMWFWEYTNDQKWLVNVQLGCVKPTIRKRHWRQAPCTERCQKTKKNLL